MPPQSSYTPELGAAICEKIATADMSLRAVARELNISHSTILFWALKNQDFADQYARAQEIRDDAAAEAIDGMWFEEPERVTVTIGENTTKTSVDLGWVAWQRERKDARKWALAKRRPKKYGDRTIHAGDDENPLTIKSILVPERIATRPSGEPKPEFGE